MMMNEIVTPELVTETVFFESASRLRLEVRFVGSADGVVESDLADYLDRIHQAALESDIGEVVFDVRGLEFLSASCLRSILACLKRLHRARVDDDGRPRHLTRLVSDIRKQWQRRSFASVVRSCDGCVDLDAV